MMAELKQGRSVPALKFGAAKKISREQAARDGFSVAETQAIFRANTQTLPSYVSTALPEGGVGIYKISGVASDEKVKQQVLQIAAPSLRQIFSDHIASAYTDSLRAQGKVSVKQAVLDKVGERN